ncbi:MAG: GNAT family N-acetyltransferase [Bacteroidales bacterium]|nr:GNAT family N-acetyltransferase [Bacteroidales bacterium]
MKIRPIKETDYEELISMFKEFAAFQKMPDKMINSVEKMTAESNYLTGFVVENDSGELIGYATYFYAYYTWIGKSLYMDDLYVKPEYRRKGLGQKLIESVINKAKTDNCKKVRWQVSDWNQNAIDFYKSIGAKVDNTESNCDYWLI